MFIPNNIRYACTTTNADAGKTMTKEGDAEAFSPPGLVKFGYTKCFKRAEGKSSPAISRMP
jgi:hypothetical protein